MGARIGRWEIALAMLGGSSLGLGCSGRAVEAPAETGGSGGSGASGGSDLTGGTGARGGRGGSSGDGGRGGGSSTGGDGPVGGEGGEPSGEGGDGSGGAGPDYDALCAATGGNELTFANEADALEKLAGRWVLCSGPGLAFATEQPNQAGVEMTTDMQWYALELLDSRLSRAGGFQATGVWRFNQPQELSNGPSMQAMLFFGVDYSFNTLTMLDSPRKMRWVFSEFSGGAASIYAYVGP